MIGHFFRSVWLVLWRPPALRRLQAQPLRAQAMTAVGAFSSSPKAGVCDPAYRYGVQISNGDLLYGGGGSVNLQGRVAHNCVRPGQRISRRPAGRRLRSPVRRPRQRPVVRPRIDRHLRRQMGGGTARIAGQAFPKICRQARRTSLSIRHPALPYWWSMILPENRSHFSGSCSRTRIQATRVFRAGRQDGEF